MDSIDSLSRRKVLLASAGVLGTSGCLRDGNTASPSTEKSRRNTACETDPAIEETDPLLRETNVRERNRCVGTSLDAVEATDRWTAGSGRLQTSSERAFTGDRSIRVEADPGEALSVERAVPNGIDFSGTDLSVAVHPGEDYPATNVVVRLLAPDLRNRVDMWQPVGGDRWIRLDPGPTNVVGSPDLTDVRAVRITTLTDESRRVRFYVDDLRATEKLDQGYVILTFDDNLASQFDTAFPEMEEFGFPGVVGTIPWDTSESGPHISLEGLAELQRSGWDVVSHPQRTDPLPTLSEAAQRSAIEESKRWLVNHGFEDGARFVIWPFGRADETTLRIGGRYHRLGFRGGDHPSGPPFFGPLTVSRVNGDDVERTKRMIDCAAAFDQVAVVMYHGIRTGEPYISTDRFEETLRYVAASDVSVITASELVDEVVR
jgi:peptidoglycan/xylan/chitin deacetylase (PgdA/CDA1 family)